MLKLHSHTSQREWQPCFLLKMHRISQRATYGRDCRSDLAISIHPPSSRIWFTCNTGVMLALCQKCSTYPHKIYIKVLKNKDEGQFFLKDVEGENRCATMQGTHCLGPRAHLLRLRTVKHCIGQIQAQSSQWSQTPVSRQKLLQTLKSFCLLSVISINAYHFKKKNWGTLEHKHTSQQPSQK